MLPQAGMREGVQGLCRIGQAGCLYYDPVGWSASFWFGEQPGQRRKKLFPAGTAQTTRQQLDHVQSVTCEDGSIKACLADLVHYECGRVSRRLELPDPVTHEAGLA